MRAYSMNLNDGIPSSSQLFKKKLHQKILEPGGRALRSEAIKKSPQKY